MSTKPIQDNTYMTYCSNLRKYRQAYETTKEDYWLRQITKLEAKILACGRELPKEKERPSVDISQIPNAQSNEVTMYKTAYQRAKELNNTPMMERFAGVLKNLGVDVNAA